MPSPLVYVVPKWTEICARDFKEGSERLYEVIIEGETKIYNFNTFTDETYHRLYDRQPNRLEDSDIKPENKIWIAIHQQMTELEAKCYQTYCLSLSRLCRVELPLAQSRKM